MSLKLNVLYLRYQNYKIKKSTCAYNFYHLHKWVLTNSANQDRGQPNWFIFNNKCIRHQILIYIYIYIFFLSFAYWFLIVSAKQHKPHSNWFLFSKNALYFRYHIHNWKWTYYAYMFFYHLHNGCSLCNLVLISPPKWFFKLKNVLYLKYFT